MEKVMTESKPKLKLVGLDGNAFSILGRAHRVARQAGWSNAAWKTIQTDAMSGDYDHLLGVMAEHFDVH
jgi:hypothetical protein